ncbi:MAG: hypothetical protein EF812_00010 [Methanosarcinales archaeon]|nr:MAG: hypothetical protein EF812_00010 [Methanosarcinales archaeon]
MGIDVWAICDDIPINFPMPYINNYLTVNLRDRLSFDYLKGILELYTCGKTFPLSDDMFDYGDDHSVSCPYDGCKMKFNFHLPSQPGKLQPGELQPGETIKCPQCLKNMVMVKRYKT